jgi:hypothetical protein
MKFRFVVKDLLLILYYIIDDHTHPYDIRQIPSTPAPSTSTREKERRPAPMACLPPEKMPPYDNSPSPGDDYTTKHLQLSLHRSIRLGINEDHSDLILMFEPHEDAPPPAVCLTEKQCVHLIACLQTCLRDLSQMESSMGND